MDNEKILILFYKYPEKGKVKTRLAQSVGDQHAFEIYNCMLNDLYATAAKTSVTKIAASTLPGGILAGKPVYETFLQEGADLGEKMLNAFRKVFSLGYSRAILSGSDCPGITAELFNEGFDALSENDYVIGPAADGGYYLIGMKSEVLNPSVFQDIPWSTSRVLDTTAHRLKAKRYRFKLLKELNDVDTLEDVETLFIKNGKDRSSQTMTYLAGIREGHHEI